MFHKTSLKLAGFFLAIIMVLSGLASIWIYQSGMQELRVGLGALADIPQGKVGAARASVADQKRVIQSKETEGSQRLLIRLVWFNAMVLLVAGPGSYFLARRVLRPIDTAMQAQNRFTADASHELRTPLTALKAQNELALLENTYNQVTIHPLLKSNVEEIDRLSDLTEGLLLLARTSETVDAGHKPQRFDQAVVATWKRMQPLARRQHVTLAQQVVSPCLVVVELTRLERMVTILLDNAIKYSPPKTTVHIELVAQGKNAILTVRDQGVGISAANLPYIFERFYRADAARTSQKTAGHGLGLAIAQKIVQDAGGHIDVESAQGSGSTFTVRLPLS
jgi:signal transduction histidine kinase